jgi:hypothetical protein
MGRDFRGTFTVDDVSAQHDPGKNSRTHYLRLRFSLGGNAAGPRTPYQTNGTMIGLTEERNEGEAISWVAAVTLDDGQKLLHRWSAPKLIRVMASLQ